MVSWIVEVDYQRIVDSGEEGALMVRLACAVNNFKSGSHLYEGVQHLRSSESTKEMGVNLSLYLTGTQIGYLCEAMLLFRNAGLEDSTRNQELTITSAPSLKPYLDALSPDSQKDYQTILALVDDPEQQELYRRRVELFRNQAAFHYDHGHRGRNTPETPITTRGLRLLAERGQFGKWTLGLPGPGLDTRRFEFADSIMDTAVCRFVWGIDPETTGDDLQREAGDIVDWIVSKIKAYVGFASELCFHYFSDKLKVEAE